ncbi:unnamed protein product [Protopolystoma xenopodis]|uniref:Uncharacterized protein n=1 Tax=Protopolystoma xenopodis TaxID=117903 RepID=A0A3S5FF30_9PLAT|nr:unnamed protein product [Protopolystoma xenopodis]
MQRPCSFAIHTRLLSSSQLVAAPTLVLAVCIPQPPAYSSWLPDRDIAVLIYYPHAHFPTPLHPMLQRHTPSPGLRLPQPMSAQYLSPIPTSSSLTFNGPSKPGQEVSFHSHWLEVEGIQA